jgi:hypothetical protein
LSAPTHETAVCLQAIEAKGSPSLGLIKSNPKKIIADGTDWRFLDESQTRAEGVNEGKGGF